MRSLFGNPVAVAIEMQGHFVPGRDTFVRTKFGAVAKILWPEKTAAQLAAIAGKDERTAKRWIAGEFEPPAVIFAAVLLELVKRE